ncbi:UNKNOWN [Stylonychia lemnae]|uniref:Uncharacterized protein n=1 Tax=Stylonychia lemnae TaxID=5949 RepID=A0A078ATY5_STYLE|nr:UNKNOWN [Stylonychia lemnae]|eukprot:CDW85870.1 UNKNOWN [Stylonychia lemnae]
MVFTSNLSIINARQTLQNWQDNFNAPFHIKLHGIYYEQHFLQMQRSLRFYEKNVYILNQKALRIQHWFFKTLSRLPLQQKKSTVTQMKTSSLQNTDITQTRSSSPEPQVIQVRKKSPYKNITVVGSSPDKIQYERVEQSLNHDVVFQTKVVQKQPRRKNQHQDEVSNSNTISSIIENNQSLSQHQQQLAQPEGKLRNLKIQQQSFMKRQQQDKDSVKYAMNQNHQTIGSFIKTEPTSSFTNASSSHNSISMFKKSTLDSNFQAESFNESNGTQMNVNEFKRVRTVAEKKKDQIKPYKKDEIRAEDTLNKIDKLLQTTENLTNLRKLLGESQLNSSKSTKIIVNKDETQQASGHSIPIKTTINTQTLSSKLSIIKSPSNQICLKKPIIALANQQEVQIQKQKSVKVLQQVIPNTNYNSENTNRSNRQSNQMKSNEKSIKEQKEKTESRLEKYKNQTPRTGSNQKAAGSTLNSHRSNNKKNSPQVNQTSIKHSPSPTQKLERKYSEPGKLTMSRQSSELKMRLQNVESRVHQETKSIKAKYGSRTHSNDISVTQKGKFRTPSSSPPKNQAQLKKEEKEQMKKCFSQTIIENKSKQQQISRNQQQHYQTEIEPQKTTELVQFTKRLSSQHSQSSDSFTKNQRRPRSERQKSQSIEQPNQSQNEDSIIQQLQPPQPTLTNYVQLPQILYEWNMNSIIFEEQNEFSESKEMKSIEIMANLRINLASQDIPSKKIDFYQSINNNNHQESTPVNQDHTPQHFDILSSTHERRLTGNGNEENKSSKLFNESIHFYSEMNQEGLDNEEETPHKYTSPQISNIQFIQSPSQVSDNTLNVYDLEKPIDQNKQLAPTPKPNQRNDFVLDYQTDSIFKQDSNYSQSNADNDLDKYMFSPSLSQSDTDQNSKQRQKEFKRLQQAKPDGLRHSNNRSAAQTVKNLLQSGALSSALSPVKNDGQQRIVEIKQLDDESESENSKGEDSFGACNNKLVYIFN